MIDPIPLARAIGDRLRALRKGRGIRQEDIAAQARRLGLPWTRATVAAIELGRRQLAVDELLLLPLVLDEAGITSIFDAEARTFKKPTVRDLLPSGDDTWLAVGPAMMFRANYLAEVAFGRQRPIRPELVRLQLRHHRVVDADHRRAWRRVWGSETPFDPDLMALAEVDALGDAETKAAASLGVTPALLALAARKRWGRSLTAERDRRLADRGHTGAEPRTLQALRGHITRELLEELRPLLEEAAQ